MSRKTMTSSTRSAIGIAVMAVMSIGIIAFSNPLYHALKGPITTNQPEIPLADGTYIHEAPEPDSNGFRDSTRITVSNGIIVSCVWDSDDAEGNGKQKLSMDGHYVMTENGPTWKAQADAVGRYVIEHQKVSGLANQDGYATDAVSSVSINVYPFINGVEECLKQAAEQ